MPIVIAVAQITLLMVCYRHETPIYLKQQGREEELQKVLEFFYKPEEVSHRYRDISASVNLDKGSFVAQKVTIWQTFTDPNLRRASLIGVVIMMC